jgi:hypothetical protein
MTIISIQDLGKKAQMIVAESKKVIQEYSTRLTVRQLFYRLVSAHVIENLVSEYQAVVNALVQARLMGEIDYDSIEDRTRAFIGGDARLEDPKNHFESAKKYFETSAEYFNLPKWLNQPKYVEVWLEKQALAALFEQVTRRWAVRLAPCRGYPSLTFLWEGAEHLKEIEGREIQVLYFGDFDPSGQDIPRYIESRLTNDLGIDTANMNFTKIAITPEQIEQYNIPPMPVKTSDSRGAKFIEEHGEHSAVELDAIDPKILQTLIEAAIVEQFDADIGAETEMQEENGREEIRKMTKDALGRERLPTKKYRKKAKGR